MERKEIVIDGASIDALHKLVSAATTLADILTKAVAGTEDLLRYPDFDEWRESAINVSGISFAPENFYILDNKGRRKEHFTWREAIDLENTILRPNGWRIPTVFEWQEVLEKNSDAFELGRNGYILPEDIRAYDRLWNSSCVHFRDSNGYFWSSTEYYGQSAFSFCIYGKNDKRIGHYYGKFYGLSLRCVAL